jgi:hypothetical protein
MLRSRKFCVAALALGAACLAAPARAADLDKLTPADAQAVLVFNVRQALDAPLSKKKGVTDIIKNAIEGNAEAKQVLAALGLDLTKDITTVSLAIGNFKELQGPKPEKLLVTVRGTFDPDRIKAAAEKADTIKTSKEGIFTLYEIKGKDGTVHATLLGKTTLVAAPSKDYLLAALKNEGAASKDLAKAAAKIDGKSSVWGTLIVTDEIRKQMASANPGFKEIADKLESLNVALHVTDSLALDLNAVTDAATAKKMKAQVDEGLDLVKALGGADPQNGPLIKEVLGGLKVTDGQDGLNINMKLSEETLDKIIKLAMMAPKPGK